MFARWPSRRRQTHGDTVRPRGLPRFGPRGAGRSESVVPIHHASCQPPGVSEHAARRPASASWLHPLHRRPRRSSKTQRLHDTAFRGRQLRHRPPVAPARHPPCILQKRLMPSYQRLLVCRKSCCKTGISRGTHWASTRSRGNVARLLSAADSLRSPLVLYP